MRRATDDRALLSLLGVDEHASWEEVRRAFRAAVRNTHPDLHGGDPRAEHRLKTLNAAWETINTPGKWAAYVVGPTSVGPSGRPSDAAPVAHGRLRVQRQRRGATGLARWMLELDGAVVANIENGGTSVVRAEPGRHALRVFYGSRSSLPLRVEVRLGEELHLGCRQLEGLRVGLLSPGRSLVLEQLGRRRFERP